MTKRITPSWLSDIAKQYWKKLSPLVDLQDDHKAETLALLCDHFATFRMAAKLIEEEGLTVPTMTGGSRIHPAVGAKNHASDQINRLSKALGLTKPGEGVTASVDPLDEFLE